MSRGGRLIAVAALGLATGGAARAETLAEAIAIAYQTNPQLAAARATQRALDETYVQARAGWGPTVGLTGQAYYQHTSYGRAASSLASTASVQSSGVGGSTTGATTTGSAVQSSIGPDLNYGYAAVTLTQPLYTGGKVAAEVQAADAAVRAGRQSLRATEASVLSAVVAAYADVLRDAAILHIRDEAVRVLFAQSEEASAKFKVGQANRVDVSQAEAQLASAQALTASARAQLAISRAEYRAAVGQSPGDLAEPPPLPGVPASVDQAFDAAEAESPLLGQAELTEAASRARLAAVRANFRPTISAQASYGAEGALVPFAGRDFDRVASGQIVLTQALFTAGLNGSLTREARAQNEADRLSIETVRRQVVQQVASAWETFSGSNASLQSDLKGLTAAQTAFDGIREEYRVGLSSTLDVLIQQQTLESAELSVASARHDAYVASAALLAAIGRLQAADLVSGQPAYDPAAGLERVKSRGVTPWEPLVAAVDRVLEPRADQAMPQPVPATSGPLRMRPAGD